MMIGNTTVVCEPQVKNLGVIFDQVMSMRQHVNYTSRTARFHLRNISRIRRYITEESCKLVVQSLVTSRLDYSNGLLYGIPKSAVSILQSVQNSAARIVTKTAPRKHITHSDTVPLVRLSPSGILFYSDNMDRFHPKYNIFLNTHQLPLTDFQLTFAISRYLMYL